MSYYQGDFYRGDFYAGDPGIMGLLGRAGKAVFQGITGGKFPRLGGGASIVKATPAAAGIAAVTGAAGTIATRAGAIITKHPVLTAAGAAGTIGALSGMGAGAMMAAPAMGMAGMRGFHLTKPVRHGPRYNPSPHLAKNRRMRVTNPKALHRAIRRCHGFARLAKRVLAFTHPRAHKGRPYFKRKRTRK